MVSSNRPFPTFLHLYFMIAPPLVRFAIFPLGVHFSCQINVFPTLGSPCQTKPALSDSPPSIPVYQLFNLPVCKNHPPTFSTLRSRVSWQWSPGSSGDNQARRVGRPSTTVRIIVLMVFKEPILWANSCETFGLFLLNILYYTCRWWV